MKQLNIFLTENILIGYIFIFIVVILFKSVLFLFLSHPRKEKKWMDIFYHKIEVFEDSSIEPKIVWSIITDPSLLINLDYKNRINWIKMDTPLNNGKIIKLRLKKSPLIKGFISCFEPLTKIVFEYHVWPNLTRYIYEVSTIQLPNGTYRYFLRIKVKKVITPLIKLIFPNLTEKVTKKALESLQKRLGICHEIASNKLSKDVLE